MKKRVAYVLPLLLALSLLASPAARMGGLPALAGDGACGEPSAGGSATWYFAEGYTGEGFQEYLVVFNPADETTALKVTPLFNAWREAASGAAANPAMNRGRASGASAAESETFAFELPSRTRVTLDINTMVGANREVSLVLEAERPVVAERPMYFTYRRAWKGCTVTSGAEASSRSWYFAEGCTRRGFETWLLLANPGETLASARVEFVLEDGGVVPVALELPPLSRRTVFVNEAVGEERDVSARVVSDAYICAERVMYFDYHRKWPGGHASSGLARPRTTYLFAEGYTGAAFEEWLTLYAPMEDCGPDGTDVTLRCLFGNGAELPFQVHLDPDKRHTLHINQLVGPDREVSMELAAAEPFLAERPIYFNYRGACRGGHVSKGVERAGERWYLAEGTTRGGFHTYLCLMNPNHEDAEVEIKSHFHSETLTDTLVVKGRSRLTYKAKSALKPSLAVSSGGEGLDVSFEVRSSLPIAVERPIYHPGASFEAANAMDHIRHLSVGIGQRVEGTEGEAAAAEYIAETLRGYGYIPAIQEVPLPNGSVTRNVIAEYNPSVSPESVKVLFVGGHYDTMGGTGSPGANDNASGTAVVLELARCFAEEPSAHGVAVRFIFFGGEERLVKGTDLRHFGSRHYVRHLTGWERERAIGAIVVDMVGVGSRLYARNMRVGPMDLCNRLIAYAQGAGAHLPYMSSGAYSDHEPFEAAGFPAVWLQCKDDPWYHTPEDSFGKIDPAHIGNAGRLLLGFIRSSLVRGD